MVFLGGSGGMGCWRGWGVEIGGRGAGRGRGRGRGKVVGGHWLVRIWALGVGR